MHFGSFKLLNSDEGLKDVLKYYLNEGFHEGLKHLSMYSLTKSVAAKI